MTDIAKRIHRVQAIFLLLSIGALLLCAGMWRYGVVHQAPGEMDEAASLSIFGSLGTLFFGGSSAGIGILWLAGSIFGRGDRE